MGNVARRPLLVSDFCLLQVDRKGKVRHAAIPEGHTAGQVGQVFDMGWPHDSFIKYCDIDKKFVERYILLCISSNEIVELKAGDGEYRCSIQLSVVKAI